MLIGIFCCIILLFLNRLLKEMSFRAEKPWFNLNYLLFVFIYLAVCSHFSLQSHETSTVKKNLKISSTLQTNEPSDVLNSSLTIQYKNNSEAMIKDDHLKSKIFFQKDPDDDEIPESFKMEFYFFIGLSVAAILFILFKIHRMKLSRAERKYGVQGDRSIQELTPLPMAIEDDSDNEDHTVFDINRQIRVS